MNLKIVYLNCYSTVIKYGIFMHLGLCMYLMVHLYIMFNYISYISTYYRWIIYDVKNIICKNSGFSQRYCCIVVLYYTFTHLYISLFVIAVGHL